MARTKQTARRKGAPNGLAGSDTKPGTHKQLAGPEVATKASRKAAKAARKQEKRAARLADPVRQEARREAKKARKLKATARKQAKLNAGTNPTGSRMHTCHWYPNDYVPTQQEAVEVYGARWGGTIWWWDAKLYFGLPRGRTAELEPRGLTRFQGHGPKGGESQHSYLLEVIYALAKIERSVPDADQALDIYIADKEWRVPSYEALVYQHPYMSSIAKNRTILAYDAWTYFGVHRNRMQEAGLTSPGKLRVRLYEVFALAQWDYRNVARQQVVDNPSEALLKYLEREREWIHPTPENVVSRYGRFFGSAEHTGGEAWEVWGTHNARWKEHILGGKKSHLRPVYMTYAMAKWEAGDDDYKVEALADRLAPRSRVPKDSVVLGKDTISFGRSGPIEFHGPLATTSKGPPAAAPYAAPPVAHAVGAGWQMPALPVANQQIGLDANEDGFEDDEWEEEWEQHFGSEADEEPFEELQEEQEEQQESEQEEQQESEQEEEQYQDDEEEDIKPILNGEDFYVPPPAGCGVLATHGYLPVRALRSSRRLQKLEED